MIGFSTTTYAPFFLQNSQNNKKVGRPERREDKGKTNETSQLAEKAPDNSRRTKESRRRRPGKNREKPAQTSSDMADR